MLPMPMGDLCFHFYFMPASSLVSMMCRHSGPKRERYIGSGMDTLTVLVSGIFKKNHHLFLVPHGSFQLMSYAHVLAHMDL